MPVLIIADLHLDFWLRAGRDPLAALKPDLLASLDALIIAGDLANKPKVRWPHAIEHLGRYLHPEVIHIVPGNHDYYDHTLNGEDRLAAICADAGVRFAQKSEIIIGDTRFLSCTLWTDFAVHGDPVAAMRIAQQDMNDYKYIRLGPDYRRIRPSDTAGIHTGHRTWLEERLTRAFIGRTIVVTHHCPHPGLISASRNAVDPAYGSDLLSLIEKHQPDIWFFGHTHHHVEAELGRTRVRNVSLGYPEQIRPDDEARILQRGLVETVP